MCKGPTLKVVKSGTAQSIAPLQFYYTRQRIVAVQRMSRLDGIITDWVELSMPLLSEGKTFQNLSVSSPAPVTMVWPHGLIER